MLWCIFSRLLINVGVLCRIELVDRKGNPPRDPCDGGFIEASTLDPFPFATCQDTENEGITTHLGDFGSNIQGRSRKTHNSL